MKLLTKLTLFITLSKLVIVVFFITLLPYLLAEIASRYTNNYLREQKKKVLDVIAENGVDYSCKVSLIMVVTPCLKKNILLLNQ
ncbi:hypothetical protein [Flavihumibacter sp. ZG627]|uniref:hypothetical protein n=1 Tax=Flavihumibacter sp. ZG627 TaxID=1463156 RepID=UPI000A8ADEAC|nr:hypothetical protein [Flavihumibacter sp. ZG627]